MLTLNWVRFDKGLLNLCKHMAATVYVETDIFLRKALANIGLICQSPSYICMFETALSDGDKVASPICTCILCMCPYVHVHRYIDALLHIVACVRAFIYTHERISYCAVLLLDLLSQVVEVDYSGDRVTVATSSGETFNADRVIVTVPLALLKAEVIRFCPPLPEKKVDAIRSLGAGIIEKVCGCAASIGLFM